MYSYKHVYINPSNINNLKSRDFQDNSYISQNYIIKLCIKARLKFYTSSRVQSLQILRRTIPSRGGNNLSCDDIVFVLRYKHFASYTILFYLGTYFHRFMKLKYKCIFEAILVRTMPSCTFWLCSIITSCIFFFFF